MATDDCGLYLFLKFLLFIECVKHIAGQCGEPAPIDSTVRVATGTEDNGNTGSVGSWPWMISVGEEGSSGNWIHKCGGSILGPKHILTAGHCATQNGLIIRAGDRDLHSANDDFHMVTRKVKSVKFHPKFNNLFSYYDVAVLELEEALVINDFIKPVCLPEESTDFDKYEGHFVTLTGWGLMSRNRLNTDSILKRVPLRIFSQRTHANLDGIFQERVDRVLPNLFRSNMMCAGYERGGYGSCKGDSGGPVVRFQTRGREHYIQLAIVQGGIGRCGDSQFPGIYVRLDDPEVLGFVRSALSGKVLPRPIRRTTTRPSSLRSTTARPQASSSTQPKAGSFGTGSKDIGTSLHRAAEYGQVSRASQMLENGAEPNLNDANGRTPLHSAAMARLPGDHLGIARLLVTRGANVNIKDNDGEFPLSMVISNNHFTSQKKVAMVKFLVEEAGANVNNRDAYGYQPIHWAVIGNAPEAVFDTLLNNGADINSPDGSGLSRTPLYIAASNCKTESLTFLLRRKADAISLTEPYQRTSIWVAASVNCVQAIKDLDPFVNINYADSDGTTPLMIATENSHDEAVKELLDRGADVLMVDNKGRNAGHLAEGDQNILVLLTINTAERLLKELENGQVQNG